LTGKTFSNLEAAAIKELNQEDEQTVRTVSSIFMRSEALKIKLQNSTQDIALTSKMSSTYSKKLMDDMMINSHTCLS